MIIIIHRHLLGRAIRIIARLAGRSATGSALSSPLSGRWPAWLLLTTLSEVTLSIVDLQIVQVIVLGHICNYGLRPLLIILDKWLGWWNTAMRKVHLLVSFGDHLVYKLC